MNEIVYCSRCFMPSSRPRISIDASGICNGCQASQLRVTTDYSERANDLRRLLSDSRRFTPYDCVLAWSGGKDSTAIALHLKEDFDLNPLLVTFSPLIPTREGARNREMLLDMGFDSIMVRPKQDVSRSLSRRFFIERGDPKVHWNAGVCSAPVRIAAQFQIPFVFYAEHGESEYGGRILSERHRMERDQDEVLEHSIGDDPMNWTSASIGLDDLYPYLYPTEEETQASPVRTLYFGYFVHWDVTENYKFVSERLPFECNARGRTYGTFSDYDSVDDVMDDLYYYMQYIKFGFGRCLRDAARMIQRGRMSRIEALDLIQQYDGEFPAETLPQCLEYLRMTEEEFIETVDRHRSPNVWTRSGDAWVLRRPPTL